MKVLHTLDSLNRGGAEMLELDVCRNAAANGIDIIFAATGGGTLESEFKDSGIPFFKFERRLPFDPRVVMWFRKLIREQGIDIVHTHQAVSGIHAWFADHRRAKHVMSYPGYYGDAKNRYSTWFLAPRIAANIPCSYGLLEWLRDEEKLDTEDFEVIYNGVDTRRIEFHGDGLKSELGLADDTVLIGMVAHFYAAPRKDQRTLVEAFVQITERFPDAHLILVGRVEDGAEEKAAVCRRIVSDAGLDDRVHFLGQRDDLAKVVNSLDIYVFSSFHEGLPIALMEAMLAAKPCVVSDIAPLAEVASDGKYASVFKTGDPKDLADKLTTLLSDDAARNDLARRGSKFAADNFSIEAHLAKLSDLYHRVASANDRALCSGRR